MATINGTNLRDIINGTSLADTILGFGGNDQIAGNGGNDVIRGGSGQDILDGNAGNDILFADSNEGGEDVLFGGADSDILVSGSGRDHLNGGSGIDAASWQDSAFGVSASLATGRGFAGGIEDTFTQMENLIGSRFNDTLNGDAGRNELFGGEGNDTLFGGDGTDVLSGGAGNDTLDAGDGLGSLRGGSGFDTVDYSSANGAVDANLLNGFGLGFDRHGGLAEIEAVRGSLFSDVITGGNGANLLSGLAGNDQIDGGGGNDILAGGSGADTFVFEAIERGPFNSPGFDSGDDVITDFSRAGDDRIDLRGHFEATTFAELRATASQFGSDTHLRLGEDTIVLEDVALGSLAASMFLF